MKLATDPTMEPTAPPEATVEATGYPVHPAANLLPSPTAEEFERLKVDIQEHGLLVPITVTLGDNGQVLILDGRSRARAYKELGFDIPQLPTFVNRDALHRYFGRSVGMDDCFRLATIDEERDPVATVLSLNAARRHLTGDQIIALYLKANAAKLEAEKLAAKATQKANLKKGAARPEPENTTVKFSGNTAEKIAKAVGKSKSAVERVQRVQKVAPEQLADVATGKISAAKALKATYQPDEETAEHAEQRRSEFKKKRAAERVKMRLMVEVGYKQLAPKFHPDTGGTTEEMITLRAARDILMKYAENWS